MLRFSLFAFCSLLFVFLNGCQTRDEATTGQEHGSTAVTLWTEKTELFMEYPALIVGQEVIFAAHFTDMKDFKPVTQGRLTCIFKGASGAPITAAADSPSSPGIFRPRAKFSQSGVYDLELRLNGLQVEDSIHVPDVRVFVGESAVPREEKSTTTDERIIFLKEQQWKIDFRNEPAQKRMLSGSVRAVGEILPKAQWQADVPALVNGIILADQNDKLPSVGTHVQKGEILAVISPPANTETTLNSIRSEYLLAKAEYERAQRLFEKQAVPQKRVDEARLKFETKQAGYEVVAQQIDFGATKGIEGVAALHFHLKAPIDGVISEIHFRLGQSVQAGEKLFTIINPKRVWLKALIPLAFVARVKAATGASFKTEGYEQEFNIDQLNGRLISNGNIVDEKSRTVEVIFELDNPDNDLKIGMFGEVAVQTGETVETLAIPTSAIFDDNGKPVAYVHIEGEAFAKRVLKTGIADHGFTQILSGITESERVVTVGGYQVRLASLSTSVPVGHGHEH